MFQQNSTEYSPWNPFLPTKRDIDRTEELAKKNPTIAGLSALFPIISMLYLNRGINFLKIFGYVFLISFIIGISSSNENKNKDLDGMVNLVSVVGQVALIVENVRCVTLARKRLATQNKIEQ